MPDKLVHPSTGTPAASPHGMECGSCGYTADPDCPICSSAPVSIAGLSFSGAKFTKEELDQLFPDGIPMLLVKLLFPDKSKELTVGELRQIARALATTPAPQPHVTGLSEVTVNDLDMARKWLSARWCVDFPNEGHVKQLAEYVVSLRTPSPQSVVRGIRDTIANIIDPHSFMPDNSDDYIVGEIVKQSRELALSKADRILAALASEGQAPHSKCAICGDRHDNDALTDICTSCEARINEEGSP